ncbi:MAG: hypothetical protein MJZ18_10650 [Bacteroidales bacterium]|nr:hypothetical protein [Bacteroidales bacterium]
MTNQNEQATALSGMKASNEPILNVRKVRSVKPTSQRTAEAIAAVKSQLLQNRSLDVEFRRYSKSGAPYARVSNDQYMEGVSLPLYKSNGTSIFNHHSSGAECNLTPVPAENPEEDENFIEDAVTRIIMQGAPLRMKSAAECPEGILVGSYPTNRGVIKFYFKRTPEMEALVKEYKLFVP